MLLELMIMYFVPLRWYYHCALDVNSNVISMLDGTKIFSAVLPLYVVQRT